MELCDHREACGGSPACCTRCRLDRPRNSAHPGILDDRQHVLGDRRRALRHRWPGPAELALASVTCRPVVAARGRRHGSHLLRRSQQHSQPRVDGKPAVKTPCRAPSSSFVVRRSYDDVELRCPTSCNPYDPSNAARRAPALGRRKGDATSVARSGRLTASSRLWISPDDSCSP